MKTVEQGAVPNFFYDLIVFVAPSVLIVLGLALGLPGVMAKLLPTIELKDIGAIDFIVVIFAVLFVAYEYGRLVEAVSHTCVTQVIRALTHYRCFRGFFQSPDFGLNLAEQVEKLGLSIDLPEGRKNNKWTIYFYALLYCPHIGMDLMKRYAWEKLARSSAFTFLVLFLASLVILIVRLFGARSNMCGEYGFGSAVYTLAALVFTLLTYQEFYLRKCWNNDLLVKVLPVLVAASKIGTPTTASSD